MWGVLRRIGQREIRTQHQTMIIEELYRSSAAASPFRAAPQTDGREGFFRLGRGSVCYGRASVETRPGADEDLADAVESIQVRDGAVTLPFDPDQIVANLRYERYVEAPRGDNWVESSWVRDVYYRMRPLFPVSVRKHMQRMYLRKRNGASFPGWPVDQSVESLSEQLLVLGMKALETDRLPFIWFWPEGHRACAVMTHDVETTAGRDFCETLMDINDEFDVKASFQVVPEVRYEVPSSYLESMRARGFEINIHGLNHDGKLFSDRSTFLERAPKINAYAEQFGARGFRSPALYRNADWFEELEFSYDMSVPNVARMEAQGGGCCTVMPFFLPGGMLELPLTTTEDYTLFHMLGDYSTGLWKQQMKLIRDRHGLMCFLIHPDYVISGRPRGVYRSLLEEIARARTDHDVWVTLPGEVDGWWRARSRMELVSAGSTWRIEGPGSERARLAFARLDDGKLLFEVADKQVSKPEPRLVTSEDPSKTRT